MTSPFMNPTNFQGAEYEPLPKSKYNRSNNTGFYRTQNTYQAKSTTNAKMQKTIKVEDKSKNKPEKLESGQMVGNPGPGHYDLNFREELKVLDHKLSARYKQIPFGNTSKRFNLKEYDMKTKQKNVDPQFFGDEDSVTMRRKKVAEQITEQIKKKEAERPSHMFKSQSERFIEDNYKFTGKGNFDAELYGDRVIVSNDSTSMEKSIAKNKITDKNTQPSDLKISKDGKKSKLMTEKLVSPRSTKKIAFNSISPRFNSGRQVYKPGPGDYQAHDSDTENKTSTKNPGAFKGSSRNHHSNLAIIMKTSKAMPGPAYLGHSSLVKKSYNKLLTPRSDF